MRRGRRSKAAPAEVEAEGAGFVVALQAWAEARIPGQALVETLARDLALRPRG